MTIVEIKHLRNGECIWSEENIGNTWHQDGQEFVLANSFATNMGITVPANYYVGLDNRGSISVLDTLQITISGVGVEPSGNGYSRQPLSSTTGFALGPDGSNNIVARSSILTFSAAGNWTSVKNVFLATTTDNSGHLISSGPLSSTRTLVAGDAITVRLTLSFSSISS